MFSGVFWFDFLRGLLAGFVVCCGFVLCWFCWVVVWREFFVG